MDTINPNEANVKPDSWTLHEELGKEYARRRKMNGGKTIHQLVAEANVPKFPRRGNRRKARQ